MHKRIAIRKPDNINYTVNCLLVGPICQVGVIFPLLLAMNPTIIYFGNVRTKYSCIYENLLLSALHIKIFEPLFRKYPQKYFFLNLNYHKCYFLKTTEKHQKCASRVTFGSDLPPIILNHCKPLTTIVVLFKFLYLSFEPSQPGDLVIVKSNLTILRELGMWK